jgi:hypothetical protein
MKLTSRARKRLRREEFALPERRALPIEDATHIRDAASRLSGMKRRGTVTPSEYKRAKAAIRRAACRHGVTRTCAARENPLDTGFTILELLLGATLVGGLIYWVVTNPSSSSSSTTFSSTSSTQNPALPQPSPSPTYATPSGGGGGYVLPNVLPNSGGGGGLIQGSGLNQAGA